MKKNITSHKLSIDLSDQSKTILEQLKACTLKPFGQIINQLISITCCMPDSTREIIQSSLEKEYFRLMNELSVTSERFFVNDVKSKQEHILTFLQLINGGIYSLPNDKKNIRLADGYLTIPTDWVLTNEDQAKLSYNAVVIECRNGRKYKVDIPHFIYFFDGKSANDLTEQQEFDFYQRCIEKCPEFENILQLSKENKLITDPNAPSRYLNIEEHMDAPQVGIFYISDAGEHPSGNPPYGAVIVRDNPKQ